MRCNASAHKMQDLTVLFGCDERGVVGKGVAARKIRFSSMDFSSSRRDDIAKDISGFKEAAVLLRNSGPYLCFTNWGNPGCIVFSHSTTIVFSRVGDRSSSVSIDSPWWVRLPLAVNKSSTKKAIMRWYKSSWRSLGNKVIFANSRKCDPVDWKP